MIKRIMIFGRPGSGKSTYAHKLHKELGLPLYHLDKYFYLENWQERDHQEFLKLQQEMVNLDSWIIDGNATKSLEMRYQQADVCLYFNLPRWLCYWRVFKRRFFFKDPHIDDRAHNCQEIIWWKLLTYMWKFEERAEKRITLFKDKYPHVKFIEINSDDDLKKLKFR